MDMLEWRSLFNGEDLEGWRQAGTGHFTVEDGLLVSHGGMGLLWYTRETFGDCLLRVVYRTQRPEDNSGVFVRIDGPPRDAWHAVHHGYEVQILATGDDWHRTGVIYSMTRTDTRADAPPGEWNILEVELDAERIRVRLNGIDVTDFDPAAAVPPRQKDYEPERGPRPAHGYIGLQNHDDASRVAFREISVRPLRGR
ncbi:MAG: 3-keto-disaccharide hydrolase [Dehalococcoidia bacterium]